MQTQVDAIIQLALSEDIGSGDLTAQSVIPETARASGQMLLKSPGVISGLDVVGRVCRAVDPAIAWRPLVEDGCAFASRTVVGEIDGPAQSVLTAERTALNFIQRLSGVATLTRTFVEAVAGCGARIVDTRKTTPGMRVLEKQAVRDGGGSNHRIGLFDGVMIKDTHIAALGGDDAIGEAVARARTRMPLTVKVEIEVANLDQLRLALDSGAEIILLDNMPVEMLREAVQITAGRAILEASGGVNLDTVRAIAETGVDLISVGALTHSAPALDISLDLRISDQGRKSRE
jgi:nicotinate-nucleotide pyrophosphorylase (carboxylating)